MNAHEITSLYRKLTTKDAGCRYVKMDLHVHSPASRCYVWHQGLTEEQEYLSNLECALQKQVSVVAITDHNTFEGYYRLQGILGSDATLKNRYQGLLVLPGVEISSFGKHFLAIFPPDIQRSDSERFLDDIGVEDPGDEESDAYKVTPQVLLRMIHEKGGLPLLAHADAGHGLLEQYFHSDGSSIDLWLQRGKAVAALMKSRYLCGICLNVRDHEKDLVRLLAMGQFKREKSLAVVYCSDSHGAGQEGRPIGERFSWVKLSSLSFHGVKVALEDHEIRLVDEPPQLGHAFIAGICVKGGFLGAGRSEDWQFFRMNENLNCLIGARGSGKTTLLSILGYALTPDGTDRIVERYDKAVIFFEAGSAAYAIASEPRLRQDEHMDLVDENPRPGVFRRTATGSFSRITTSDSKARHEALRLSPIRYGHKDLSQLAGQPSGPLAIIDGFLRVLKRDQYIELFLAQERALSALDRAVARYWTHRGKGEIAEVSSAFLRVREVKRKITRMRREVVDSINHVLQDQLFLSLQPGFSREDREQIVEQWPREWRLKYNITYQEVRALQQLLERILDHCNPWVLPLAVLEGSPDMLVDSCKGFVSLEDAERLVRWQQVILKPDDCTIHPQDMVKFAYNVNLGFDRPTKLVEGDRLSMGQKAVALLLVILRAGHILGDDRPLVIDQPEEDLDNVYIYSSLVQEIRKVKASRQLIFATHNANLPVCGDAENIIALQSDGEYGWIEDNGSVDKESLCGLVSSLLEGGREALALRSRKYPPYESNRPSSE